MSLLWPDEIRIGLCRDRAILARFPGGRGSRPIASHVEACESAPRGDWRPALRATADALRDLDWRKARVTVILSNEFVRYHVIPWHDRLVDGNERVSYARHLFAEVHGDPVSSWELRVSQEKYRGAGLASAIDSGLVESLEAASKEAGLDLASIQPYLMAAFNQFRSAMAETQCCFTLVERDRLCLALVRGHDWVGVRNLPLDDDAATSAVTERLDRELFLSGWDPGECGVFVHAPEHPSLVDAIAEAGKWRVRELSADQAGVSAIPGDSQHAMATPS